MIGAKRGGLLLYALGLVLAGGLVMSQAGGPSEETMRDWQAHYGQEAALKYEVTYACGHLHDYTHEEVSQNVMGLEPEELRELINGLHADVMADGTVVLVGHVPDYCRECQTYCFVGEQGGLIAVFRGKPRQGAPVQFVTDIQISRLPEQEQQRLRVGVLVASEAEAAQLIEGLDR